MSTHTRGPWTVRNREQQQVHGWTIDAAHGGSVAERVFWAPDADLIADAPALLDALAALRVDLVVGCGPSAALRNAEALLRKHGRLS